MICADSFRMRSSSDRSFLSVTLPILRRPATLIGLFMAITIVLQFLMILNQGRNIDRLCTALQEDMAIAQMSAALAAQQVQQVSVEK